jgi:hypothetical protein
MKLVLIAIRYHHILATADTTQHTAGVIACKTICKHFIAMLTAFLGNALKSLRQSQHL